jgi:tRNA(fMet)-specific endonuclease VapC
LWGKVCTSIVIAAELRYGADKKGSPRLSSQVQAILAAIEVLPLEPPSDTLYGSVRTQLERTGRPIGSNDLLIAAHALSLGCTVVTDDEKEFSRIAGLSRENWLH